jgi:hypothetical protein
MLSDNEDDQGEDRNMHGEHDDAIEMDDDEEGQGYDGYLRSTLRDGTVPVPVIPAAVEIELDDDERTAEKIPEDDLRTIAMVMSSFSLPAPDWARSIPEERWLPKIVQQAEEVASGGPLSADMSEDGAKSLP